MCIFLQTEKQIIYVYEKGEQIFGKENVIFFPKSITIAVLLVISSCANMDDNEQVEEYELLTVNTENHELQTDYAAQIKGKQDIRIIPRVEGYLQEIKVLEGQHVKQGQLLFVIDQVAYRATVKTAEANLEQAKALVDKAELEYEGKQQLYEKHVISEFDLNQTHNDLLVAKANLEAAQATLTAARNDLSFTELRSPSDGVIGRIPYRKGDFVSSSSQEGLTIVSENHEMYVYFSLSENQVMEYLATYGSMQQTVEQMPQPQLMLPIGKIYEHMGKVESISGIVDEQTGAVSVRAVFPNPDGLLLSGGTARVVMPQLLTDVIVIPQEATYEILDKVYVYKVEDGVTKACMIMTESINNGKQYVVRAGLHPGDVIIAKGAGLMKEGTRVSN